MNQDDLKAITTIVASADFAADRLWLNGVEEDISRNGRVQAVLAEIRARAGDRVDSTGAVVPAATLAGWRVHIVSRNTFPTAAGLASSAAGYACLVHTLADVFAVKERFAGAWPRVCGGRGAQAEAGRCTCARAQARAPTGPPLAPGHPPPPPPPPVSAGELSTIARQGSGSACRSLYGGFVRWEMGSAQSPDALDSKAVQVADEAHWPELVVLIAVASEKKKETGSTDGMQRSVATSALLAHRAAAVVPGRLAAIEAAYHARDFPAFARLTMADSNQFHATCLDTYPPVFYMNETSRRIVGLVHRLNGEEGGPKRKGAAAAEPGVVIAGYTFDAGPNAVIFTTAQHAPTVLAALLAHFPPPVEADAGLAFGAGAGYVSSPQLEAQARGAIAALPPAVACAPGAEAEPGSVRHIYVTSVGDGPRTLFSTGSGTTPPGVCLADCCTGLPHVVAASADGVFDKAL